MKRRVSLTQLKKFDVTQKVVQLLADVEARAIIFSTVRKSKTASELSVTLNIPLSSVYKKLSDLQEFALIKVEKSDISDDGKRHKFYRSRISKAEIVLKKQEPMLTMHPNKKTM